MMSFAYFAILAQLINASGILKIRETQDYDMIWNSKGSKTKETNSAFWQPHLLSEREYFVSFVNAVDDNYHQPVDIVSIVITEAPDGALASPLQHRDELIEIWSDTHFDTNVYFYKAVAPIDYVCFGDLIEYKDAGTNYQPWSQYKCIHEDYISVITDAQLELRWKDTHADDDFQVIEIILSGYSSYPYQYYKFTNEADVAEIDGPFYGFNLKSKDCEIIKVDINENLSNQILTGVADYSSTTIYTNTGVNVGTTKGFDQTVCTTSSSSFTHTKGSEVGIETTYGYKATVGATDGVVSAEVETSFELGVSATWSEEWEKTTTTEQEICQNIPAQEVPCPGRTTCKREYIQFTAPNEQIPISITIQCGIEQEIIEGIFEAKGAASILVEDTFIPLDCMYYTDDYADRGNGKLPFCDTCYETNECLICRDGMVLVNDGCYEDRICTEECGGEIESPSQTVPHSTEPDFAGRYCEGEKHRFKFKNCPQY